jgi:hypothetical protein
MTPTHPSSFLSDKGKQNEEDDEKSQIIAYNSDLKDQRELENFLQHISKVSK